MTAAHPRLLDTSTRHGDAILRRLPPEGSRGPLRVVEVGVCRGVLSAYLLVGRPDLHLTMVDWWTAHEPDSAAAQWSRDHQEPINTLTPEQVADNREAAHRVAARFPDRATILAVPSIDAARLVPAASADLVFLDADHREASVAADLAAWLPAVKPGGWIGGHDYGTPELAGSVERAVDRFVAAHALQLQRDTFFTWFARVDFREPGL